MNDSAGSSPGDPDDDRARFVGINHLVLPVEDVDDALDFYRGILAFDLRGRSDSKAFVDAGDQFLVLAESDADAGGTDDARHFGLVVDDPAAVERRLEGTDAEVLETPGLDFLDPWGNRVQVVAYGEIQFSKAEGVLRGMGLDVAKSDSAIEELEEKGLAPERGR